MLTRPANDPLAPSSRPPPPRPFESLPWSVLLVAVALAVASCLYVSSRLDGRRAAEEQKLLTISDLKAREVERWREHLERHAASVARRRRVVDAAEELLREHGSGTRAPAAALLEEIASAERYELARFVSPDGVILASSSDAWSGDASPDGSGAALHPVLRGIARSAIDERRVVVAEPVLHGDELRLVTAVPVNGPEGRPVAAVVMDGGAEEAVFRDLRRWPVPSVTGEIRVVRRAEAHAESLAPGRGEGLPLRLPLWIADEVSTSPLALAALGRMGVVHGDESDGRSVMAALRPIAGTDWVLVASLDLAEVDREIWALGGQVAATAFSLLGAAAAALALSARRRAVDLRAREAAMERARELAAQAKLLDSTMDALRASEAKFRLLATHVPAGIFQLDERGSCVYANEELRALVGLEERAALGRGWRSAIHPVDRDRVEEEWARAWSDGRLFRSEHRVISAGRVRWVHVAAMALRDGEAGPVTGGVGVVADVSDLKQLRAQLSRAERLALLGKLAARMGHQLNSPLGSVLSNTRFAVHELRRRSDPELQEALEALEDSVEATQRAAAVVRGLQVFTRTSGPRGDVDVVEALHAAEEDQAKVA